MTWCDEGTVLTQRIRERDLRAKAGSDAESLEHAKELLAHVDERTAQRWYRRKPTRVKPGRGVRPSE
jgi:hypothetical protein